MKFLEPFITEYKEVYSIKKVEYESGLVGDVKKIRDELLNPKFLPSVQLKSILDKLLRRSRYPMEIAITGQFSSGKSTFLNALLSRNILPTGITPVTSKVNFINYGDEYKLKITYKSGAEEYHSIDHISAFTDQREADMDEIRYLTLYAPMDVLKDITFVDTPGLNSQSQGDTDTTKKVLRDVDGIIWLTLIDNAGKMSEAEVLEDYMENFKNKSLCVLNQKDKFTTEQIETTTKYVSDKFSKYFAKVIPISAKQALDSRAHQKRVLLENMFEGIIGDFKKDLKSNYNAESLDFFQDKFNNYQNDVKTIRQKDIRNDMKLMKESNIQEVLSFIEETIRPQASEAKEFSIKKDLKGLCDILINEYNTILGVYDSLVDILKVNETPILEAFDNIHKKYSHELVTVYNSLELIMEKISNETFKNIKRTEASRFEEVSGFILGGNKIIKVQYDTFWIDSDNIYKNLFYDDQTVEKMLKRSIKMLKKVEAESDEAFRNIYRLLKTEIHKWQEPYEKIKKHREIASDNEFSNTRHFAAKIYEHLLKSYHRAILENISALRKKFAYFSGALSYSNMQVTQATIAHFEQLIAESVELYEKEPTKFSVYYPREDEIHTKIKANFGFERIEDFLTSKRNYLFKIVKYSKEQYLQINEESMNFVEDKKKDYLTKIIAMEKIKEDI